MIQNFASLHKGTFPGNYTIKNRILQKGKKENPEFFCGVEFSSGETQIQFAEICLKKGKQGLIFRAEMVLFTSEDGTAGSRRIQSGQRKKREMLLWF